LNLNLIADAHSLLFWFPHLSLGIGRVEIFVRNLLVHIVYAAPDLLDPIQNRFLRVRSRRTDSVAGFIDFGPVI
jgi:hypothetical protein